MIEDPESRIFDMYGLIRRLHIIGSKHKVIIIIVELAEINIGIGQLRDVPVPHARFVRHYYRFDVTRSSTTSSNNNIHTRNLESAADNLCFTYFIHPLYIDFNFFYIFNAVSVEKAYPSYQSLHQNQSI